MFAQNLLRLSRATILRHTLLRNVSILTKLQASPVLVSANKDVYTNLALEHWLYTNLLFDDGKDREFGKDVDPNRIFHGPVVLIWVDEPCVVIGRHQNPWTEANMGFISSAGIRLARRHSGGGCVFHDENNINISIIGHRNTFENRQKNLDYLANVIYDKYKIKCESTKRNDLIHTETGLKLSGSAAKLGKNNCYHHFTLLVDTDKETMQAAIRREPQDFIKTNSTSSHRSKVLNLREVRKDLEVNKVINDLANEYTKVYAKSRPELKSTIAGDQIEYDSLLNFKRQLETWDWIYAMTPKFSLEKVHTIVQGGSQRKIRLWVNVCRGLIETVGIDDEDHQAASPTTKATGDFLAPLIGTRFTYKDAMVNVARLLQLDKLDDDNNNPDLDKIAASLGMDKLCAIYLLQMIQDSNF